MTYRAVFFDAGETLVHPHPSFPEMLGRILQREGYDIDQALVRRKLHLVSEHFAQAARDGELWTTSPERSKEFWLRVYRTFLGEMGYAFSDGLGDVLYAEFTDLANYRLFPDVGPALERLSAAGLALGVVSNYEGWLEALLEALEVSSYFGVRVISGLEGIEKPDPAIFRLALDRAEVEPSESVFVGDNPAFDTEPAEALGMLGVLIDRRGRYPEYPRLRITSLEQLPALVGASP